jgi:hypothetical protein
MTHVQTRAHTRARAYTQKEEHDTEWQQAQNRLPGVLAKIAAGRHGRDGGGEAVVAGCLEADAAGSKTFVQGLPKVR